MPAPPIINESTVGIEREQVVVDSDYVEAQMDDGQDTPFGSPTISLSLNTENTIVWTVLGPETIEIDATTEPE